MKTKFTGVALVLSALSLVACSDEGDDNTGASGVDFDAEAHYASADFANHFDVNPGLEGAMSLDAPNFVPAADSPLAGAGLTPPAGAFFEATDYIGAFEPAGEDWTAGWTVFTDDQSPAHSAEVVTISENITEDTTWTSDKIYNLASLVFVDGATLTIEPGTTVTGDNGTALVIARNAMLDAEGSAQAPIVFTSNREVSEREPGDWGGLVLLGSAPTNLGTDSIEGMEASDLSSFGGEDANHNCGTLRYVRIEFAGYVFGEDNELNSLTLGGCGSATTLEYIQTYRGLDDGIEFFGGNANLKRALVVQTGDDSLDWDQGYQGMVQFFVALQSPGAGDRAIEADNLKANPSATPRSNPELYNLTFIGGGDEEQLGIKFRRGTAASMHNAVIYNFGKGGVDIDGTETVEQAQSGGIELTHSLMFEVGQNHFKVSGN